MVRVLGEIAKQTAEILSCGHAADRPREYVVEISAETLKFRQRPAQRLLDRAVHSAAHEHAAAFYIHRRYGVREQHDGQDEPGCGLPMYPSASPPA